MNLTSRTPAQQQQPGIAVASCIAAWFAVSVLIRITTPISGQVYVDSLNTPLLLIAGFGVFPTLITVLSRPILTNYNRVLVDALKITRAVTLLGLLYALVASLPLFLR
jgi:hypothetical protein